MATGAMWRRQAERAPPSLSLRFAIIIGAGDKPDIQAILSQVFGRRLYFSMSDYRRWLLSQLRFVDHINGHPEPSLQHLEELRDIIDEAEKRAAVAGLAAAVEDCQIRQGPITPDFTRKILAACLGKIGLTDDAPSEQSSVTLTVPEVARDMQVARDKVYQWIRSRRLEATNVNKPGARPSYRITPEALADFKAKNKLAKVEPKSRAGNLPNVIEFF